MGDPLWSDPVWASIDRQMHKAIHQELDRQIFMGFRDADGDPIPAKRKGPNMPKAIKAKQLTGGTSIRKPQCPVHEVDMTFLPPLGRWKCMEDGCLVMARRKDDGDEEEARPSTKPAVMPPTPPRARGLTKPGHTSLRIQAEFDGSESYWLSYTLADGTDISLEITGNVETVIDDQTNSVSLVLLFNDVRRT